MDKENMERTVNTKTETISIEKPLNKDDLQFQKLMQFAKLASVIKKDLNNPQVNSTFNKTFKKSNVIEWLANPSKYEKKLRDLSRFLLDSSSHYRRLIDYFSTMLTFDYVVDIYNHTEYKIDKDIVEKKYINTINYLENMNLKHEFSKLLYKAFVDDVAYGYEYSTKNSYFIDILNPDYCSISSIEDGVYNFSYNFQFFDIHPKELERFDNEFKEKYELYKLDKKNKKWQELDSKKTICIKISDVDYTIPPLAGIFEEIYSLYTYKDLQLSKTELENYLLLVAKIPYKKDSDSENSWALSLDKAIEYFNLMSDNLPSQIGSILSPYESIESIKLNKSEKELDNVTLAENSIYNAAGVPKLIFNSDKSSGAALKMAVSFDEATVFSRVLRQLERWTNRKLKDENKKVNFKVTFLNITENNRKEAISNYKEASTLGLPVKRHYCAALGLSPSDMMNSMFLENDIIDIVNKFKPLSTSYTQVGNDKGGRENKGNNIEGSTETGQELDTNNPDNRV